MQLHTHKIAHAQLLYYVRIIYAFPHGDLYQFETVCTNSYAVDGALQDGAEIMVLGAKINF